MMQFVGVIKTALDGLKLSEETLRTVFGNRLDTDLGVNRGPATIVMTLAMTQ